jgi:hypothetical protein
VYSRTNSFQLSKLGGVTIFINRIDASHAVTTIVNGNDRVVKVNIQQVPGGPFVVSQKYVSAADAEAGVSTDLAPGQTIRVRVDVYKDAFSLAAACLKSLFGAGCTIDQTHERDFVLMTE